LDYLKSKAVSPEEIAALKRETQELQEKIDAAQQQMRID
jgi:hypothetical protein